jgi:TgpA N-terminal domain/Transglutaminase-like superfamily/Domain of unknown function (DUF4129)
MAAQSEPTGTRDRRLLVAALAALAAVTGAAFGRVFIGSGPALRLALAGALAVLLAAALRRQRLFLSLLVSGAALVLVIGVAVFPDTTFAGLPTSHTAQAILDALGRVGTRAAQEVAPARPLPPLMVAGLIAVWTAASASHALAARSRSTVLPLLPPAALLAFAGVVVEDGSRPGYVVGFLVAAFAVLFAGSLLRMHQWAPVSGRASHSRVRLATGTAARWARRMSAAALVVALVVPGLLPGFAADPLIKVRSGGGRLSVSPIVDIRPNLLQNPPAELFTVEAVQPAYWRMVALDRFDGRVWRASDLFARDGELIQGTQSLPGGAPVDAIRLEQEIEIGDLSVQWLPAAYQPVEVALGEDFTARHDLVSGVLVGEGETPDGYRYRVTSDVVVPSAQELGQAYEGRVVSASVESYTNLPIGVPAEIYGLAQEIAGDGPPFQQVLAIQEYLRRFSYDEKAPAGHGIDDMLFFLKRSQRGYCEQFAGTMAVLVRTLGLPARVAVGFLSGDRGRGGLFRVTSDHIHAWPEVYFPTFGWVAFEPTPTRSNPQARYLAQAPIGVRPDANLPGAGGAATGPGARGRPQQAPGLSPGGPQEFAEAGPRTVRPFPWGRLALGLLTLALLAGVLIPAGKALARRLAVSRAASPRRKVIAAYSVLEASAADLGMGRRPGETLWEYRARLRDGVGFSDGHLERITGLTGQALYSTSLVRAQDATEAALASRQVVADLRRHVGAARRVAGAVRLSRPG